MPREFFSAAETRRADVQAVAGFTNGIRAFDSDGVGEIATTAVAFDLKTRFGYGCGRCWSVSGNERERTGVYSGFLRVAGVVSSCE